MDNASERASFGDLVRQHRLEARLTQASLAERAGISLRAVQDLERNVGRPQRETARRLAEALALTAERRAEFDRAAAPVPRSRATASRPVPDHTVVAESLAPHQPANVGDFGGEQKRVTVLFAEVAGLTESVHGFEPDLADQLQSSIVPLLVEVVHRYRGTVNRVGGDGIMAIFGAPVAHEDDAVQACSAASELHQAFDRFTGPLETDRSMRLGLKVGLASSEVVLRRTSNDLYEEYAALGPAVRVATRLGQLAAGGTTLLTLETVRAAEGYIRVQARGLLSAGGSDPESSLEIEAFELIGGQPARTRFQRVVTSRQLTRLVGRDADLDALAVALGRARNGRGQIVALVGDPGVGKSRLIWEATRSAETDGWLVLQTGADSHAASSAYGPIIDLLKAYCRIEARDDSTSVREKLTQRILTLDTALAPDLPPLFALLDAIIDNTAWEALDPPRRREWTFAALKRVLLRQAQAAPLFLVVEDLHWIDGETQAFLDALVESMPAAHLLLVVSYRPEYEHHWVRKTYYAQLRVDALQTEAADQLLSALIGDDAALHSLRQLLIVKTEGNPLFLEESVRSLADSGVLVGERGGYRQARPIDTIRVPDTVQTVLSSRIDRLQPETKRLLQLAAVIGKDVPYSLLRAIVDVPDDDLRGTLNQLLATEFMYEAQLFPELTYTFKHALIQDVAYGSVLQDRRRALHARIVEAIERTSEDRIVEHVDTLGHHAVQGQLWDKAVTYLRQAGQRDSARSANRQAARHFEQALQALNHLPNHRDAWELGIDIRLDLRNVLVPLGEFGTMFDHLQTAEALATALDDRHRLGWVSAYLAACYCNSLKPREAETSGLRAMAIADELADFPLQVMSHFFVGLVYVYACRFRESVEPFTWNVERLQGEIMYQRLSAMSAMGEPGLPAIFTRSYLMRALAELGDFEAALARGEESVDLSEFADYPFSQGLCLEGLGYVHLRRGEIPQAIAILERGLEVCERWQLHLSQYVVQAYLGYAYALVGTDSQAMPLLAASAATDGGFHPALRVALQGEAHLLAGRLDAAQQCVNRALALADLGEEQGTRAWTLRLAAEVLLANEGLEGANRAAEQYRAALALATDLEMRPLQAHCHLGLGKLYRRMNWMEEARVELTGAITMLQEMQMQRWLPEAHAELAETSERPEITGVSTEFAIDTSAHAT